MESMPRGYTRRNALGYNTETWVVMIHMYQLCRLWRHRTLSQRQPPLSPVTITTDNFQCHQWWQNWLDDNSLVSVKSYNPAYIWRDDNVIITSKQRRFDVIITLLLRHVSAGNKSITAIHVKFCSWKPITSNKIMRNKWMNLCTSDEMIPSLVDILLIYTF